MLNKPKKPVFIASYRWEQLWIVIPVCIFSSICSGVGMIGAILIFTGWIIYSAIATSIDWDEECKNGWLTHDVDNEYLKKQGFTTDIANNNGQYKEIYDIYTQPIIDARKAQVRNWREFMPEEYEKYLKGEKGWILPEDRNKTKK